MHEKSIGPFTLRSHPVSVERQSGAIGHWLLDRDPLPRKIAGWTLLFDAGWDPIDPTMHSLRTQGTQAWEVAVLTIERECWDLYRTADLQGERR